MTVTVSFFNALGRISPSVETEIRAGINEAILALREHTDVEEVGIAVHPSTFVSSETGLSGIALGPENCSIYVDPEIPQLAQNTRVRVAAMTVHEVHHVLRMKRLKIHRNEDWTAGQVLVLEGLATQTELFLGYPDPQTIEGVTYDAIAPMLERIKPMLNNHDGDWAWINEPSGLPDRVYRAAYPMGHHVVGRYCERTEETPFTAIGEPWRNVWEIGIA